MSVVQYFENGVRLFGAPLFFFLGMLLVMNSFAFFVLVLLSVVFLVAAGIVAKFLRIRVPSERVGVWLVVSFVVYLLTVMVSSSLPVIVQLLLVFAAVYGAAYIYQRGWKK